MPTIATEGPFALVIYPRDHLPPHVHVQWGGKEARLNLYTLEPLTGGDRLPAAGLRAVRKHWFGLAVAWFYHHPGGLP